MVAEIHTDVIHRKDASGSWQPMDPTLAADNQGNYAADLGHFQAKFTAQSQGNRVTLALYGGTTIAMGLDEALPDSVDTKDQPKQASFSASAVSSEMQYKEARGLMDYEYGVSTTGLKETITLHKYTGKNEFVFPLDLGRLKVRDDGNGHFSLLDHASGALRAEIPPGFAVDAAGKTGVGAADRRSYGCGHRCEAIGGSRMAGSAGPRLARGD